MKKSEALRLASEFMNDRAKEIGPGTIRDRYEASARYLSMETNKLEALEREEDKLDEAAKIAYDSWKMGTTVNDYLTWEKCSKGVKDRFRSTAKALEEHYKEESQCSNRHIKDDITPESIGEKVISHLIQTCWNPDVIRFLACHDKFAHAGLGVMVLNMVKL